MKTTQSQLQSLLATFLSKNPGGEQKLADELQVSCPTLKRWKEGNNLPCSSISEMIVKHLKKKLRAG